MTTAAEAVMFGWGGLLMVLLGTPLALGKVGPNRGYGFRVKKTLRDPGVWYPANRVAGVGIVLAGWFTVLFVIVAYVFELPVWFNLIALLGSLGAACTHAFLYLRKL